MVQINWTIQAINDLKSIAEFISKDSKAYAKLQVGRIRSRTEILKTHNNSGRIVPEINLPKIRELIEGNYRIIYTIVSENQVDILTIHHNARDLSKRKLKLD
ncbi:MAG: type II toxin-antitoxin system RelE/ParE family toxin [Chitinophagales bacterium]